MYQGRNRVFYDEIISQPAFVISIGTTRHEGSQGLFPTGLFHKKPHFRLGINLSQGRPRYSSKILKKVGSNSPVFLFREPGFGAQTKGKENPISELRIEQKLARINGWKIREKISKENGYFSQIDRKNA